MRTLRVSAYVFALVAMAITAPLTVDAGQQGIVVAVLGGTLAMTPYMVVRAIEELSSESVESRRHSDDSRSAAQGASASLRDEVPPKNDRDGLVSA